MFIIENIMFYEFKIYRYSNRFFFLESVYISIHISYLLIIFLILYLFYSIIGIIFLQCNINKQCKISLRKQGKLWEKMYSYWWIDVLVVFSFLQFQWLNHRTFFFSPDVLIERGLLYVVRIWPLPYSFHGISIGQTTINDRNAFVYQHFLKISVFKFLPIYAP